ncbi:hypothetical protein J7W19_14405 [Streptomyces mobaraensis NBRC 13819 = DSM 40847]|uniref:Aminoacyl-transfer RNA synthetases class-II family profile domain-containing protein n=1 Tax=Streptomyces mobaraensis (strain ATCC 29032 / DSM 40847 / JCM 4168 / NBRC 13819 / NCIMB 11159 / IPCR 16-22) TaxID=1223523 RepID=M3BY28_STRM1|nr:hypothetical protein [Streptomyces mobaraensis]EME96675.1 hypothetical protein H340_30298 [Streptomyces mobaraensis NBRC 13819 = DSM 40847]QTT74441.1 hypothetical protein J7W19_14405 [Streptomyces mobaraensis NBRC 13819 = DSM 40847]
MTSIDTPAARAADDLTAGGWALPAGAVGTHRFTPKFEAVIAGLQARLTALGGTEGPVWHPPVLSRSLIDRAEYAESFPHLLGSVNAMAPQNATEGDADGVVLAPAACYPVYPGLADGTVEGQAHFDVAGYCYRHEATSELGRFRTFRMREFVTVGAEEPVTAWRNAWIERGEKLFAELGVAVEVKSATDPFFGPGGRLMRASQLEQDLKYEFVAKVSPEDPGTAIASANCHKDHLGARFAVRLPGGGTAHSACAAFGLERIALALINAHGDDLNDWPALAAALPTSGSPA